LYKLKRWIDVIQFYNKIEKEDKLHQTELFINFVNNVKKNNLLSDEQLLNLSNYIEDPINKHIFVKNIEG
jgi:hypothetical protein